MISRRNIRVKVMQTLYTLASMPDDGGKPIEDKGKALLEEKLSRSLDLFTTTILYLINIAQYAERDAGLKASKYAPTTADLNINTKIAGNTTLWAIKENTTFAERIKNQKLDRFIDEEWVKKIYSKLVQSEEYAQYVSTKERTPAGEKAILQYIWEKEMVESEGLMEQFSDELAGWEDDKQMIIMLMANFFRNDFKVNFLHLLSPEKAQYARELLLTTMDKEAHLMEVIQPKLANWDKERLAMIDLLLLRMGVCEFLYFPTIPTKVTINEYIEIGKQYSTPQSGQFINGVLDNILKDLEKQGIVRKQERYRKS